MRYFKKKVFTIGLEKQKDEVNNFKYPNKKTRRKTVFFFLKYKTFNILSREQK